METQDILVQNLEQKMEALMSSHKRLIYTLIAFLFLVVVAVGFFGWRSLKSLDEQMVQAEVNENEWKTQESQIETQISSDHAFVEQMSKQQEQLIRDAQAANKRADAALELVKAAQTPQQVASDSTQYLKTTPSIESDKLCYEPEQVKQFIETGIQKDNLTTQLSDAKAQLSDEKNKTADLTSDLDKETKARQGAEKIANQYKNLAHKSKFRKFLDGVVKGAEIAGGIVAGYEIGKRL